MTDERDNQCRLPDLNTVDGLIQWMKNLKPEDRAQVQRLYSKSDLCGLEFCYYCGEPSQFWWREYGYTIDVKTGQIIDDARGRITCGNRSGRHKTKGASDADDT